MGDVADMLGLAPQKSGPTNTTEEALKFLQDDKTRGASAPPPKQLKKPKGMKREVFDLLGKDGIIPAVHSSASVSNSFMTKRNIAGKGKWLFEAIDSSARTDNQKIFFHWVKAEMNYSDYPYAKFNVKLEKVKFSDEEYHQYLEDEQWSQEDTWSLLEACHQYDLRWPVIFDRLSLTVHKTPEEVQNRFYAVQNKLHSVREFSPDRKLHDFDVEKETKRRLQQNLIYKR